MSISDEDFDRQSYRDGPNPADHEERSGQVLGERVTGKADVVTPDDPSPRTVARATKAAVAKRQAKAPAGGVYVVYNANTPVQIHSAEVKALRYAAENGYKVRKVAYGEDLD